MLSLVNGYKTYIVAAATVVYALIQWWSGGMSDQAAMTMILSGAGLGALRHGMSKS